MTYLGTKYPAFDPERPDNLWDKEDPPEFDCGDEDLEDLRLRETPLERLLRLTAYERWLFDRRDPE